jgi:hypothetical protein
MLKYLLVNTATLKTSLVYLDEAARVTELDLAFIHHGAAWIMAELLRDAQGITMEEAGALIELVQTSVDALVEDIDGTRLVHASTSIEDELLILLRSTYPERLPQADILASLSARNSGSVKNKLAGMRTNKLIFGDNKKGYRLTAAGYNMAGEVIRQVRSIAA